MALPSMRIVLTTAALALPCVVTMAQEPALVLEEIIVSAQKREQGLQEVPIAISAFTAEMLTDRNIYNIVDLQHAIPSLIVTRGYNLANGVPLVIRGMGTIGAQPSFEGSVGSYVDGIYRSRPGMVLSSMLDIGKVEVLRGPQGTLFGKNTTAGALNITSNRPAEEFGYGAEITVGDYSRQRLAGHVTGPLTDTLRGRLAILSDQRDGFTEAVYAHNDYDDLDTTAARLSLQWTPGDTLSIDLIADYSDSSSVCCFGNPVPYNRAGSLTGGPFDQYYRAVTEANFGAAVDLLALDADDRATQNNVEPSNENTDAGLVLDIRWQFADSELASLTGYREWDYTSAGDFDFGPVDIGFLSESYDVSFFSQEFNFSGSTGKLGFIQELDYVAGLFYAREEFRQDRSFDAGADQEGIWEIFWPKQAGLPEPLLRTLLGGGAWATTGATIGDVRHDLETQTAAVFVHASAALTERFSLILGLRYTDEEKTMDRQNRLFADVNDYSDYLQEFMLGGYMLGANIAGPDLDDTTYSDDEWTYDIKFQYFTAADWQIYGGYSRGFKSGGIGMDPEAGGGQPSGQNSPLLAGLGVGNGTGFADPNDPTYDAEYIDTWELGLKTDFLAGRGRLNLAAFYNDLKDNQFSVFTGTGFTVLNASSAEVSGIELESFFALTEHLRVGAAVTWLDTRYGDDIPEPAPPGRELTLAPEWAAALNLGYERPLAGDLNLFINANWSYQGEQYVAYDIQDRHPDYSLLGLQVGLRAADERWDVRAWCDNCLDETYATGYFNAPFYFDDQPAAEQGQYQGQFLGEPRTYGISLRLNY